MLASLATAVVLLAAAPTTWTLYERPGSFALAHETPDSDVLDAVLECQAGSGVVTISFYADDRPPADAQSARLTSDDALAVVTLEGAGGVRPYTRLAAPTNHPVFQAFARTGALSIEAAGHQKMVEIEAARRPDLARFVKGCG